LEQEILVRPADLLLEPLGLLLEPAVEPVPWLLLPEHREENHLVSVLGDGLGQHRHLCQARLAVVRPEGQDHGSTLEILAGTRGAAPVVHDLRRARPPRREKARHHRHLETTHRPPPSAPNLPDPHGATPPRGRTPLTEGRRIRGASRPAGQADLGRDHHLAPTVPHRRESTFRAPQSLCWWPRPTSAPPDRPRRTLRRTGPRRRAACGRSGPRRLLDR